MEQAGGVTEDRATILFVDDNAALLRSVERLLRMEGFRVVLAVDGVEALQLLEESAAPPDLIISDIAMPRMDGFRFFEEVRQRPGWLGIPFVFLTARDQIDDLRRGYSLGVDDYLVKPLDQERLLLVIRSKLKRKQELLSHIQGQQSALDKAKRELAVMVAHELRTPLVSISMVSDILAREMPRMGTDQVQDMLDTMQSGSIRLTRLVEQMVMFVQLESGALGDSIRQLIRPSSARGVVLGAIERARGFCYRERDVEIQFEEFDSGVLLSGDSISLQHALAEVILNAVAFSAPGERVMVTEWLTERMVWISVCDQGPGIAEDEREHIFEPFYQSDRQRHEQQGVGIGLSLARGIIEAHGGLIDIRSTPGKGTQVMVGLPVALNRVSESAAR